MLFKMNLENSMPTIVSVLVISSYKFVVVAEISSVFVAAAAFWVIRKYEAW